MFKLWGLRLAAVLMVATILASVYLHFYKIDSIPYGYHVDELSDAVTIQCLGTEGIDAHNNRWPLFGQLDYGTPKPATYMYPAVLWGKAFGYNVPSLRTLSVVVHLIGIIGLFYLGRVFYGTFFGLWVSFFACISPWLWVPSRVAFESLLAPTCMIWGLFFFFRRQSYPSWILSGLLFSAAMYSYPPMRLQIPLMLITLGVYALIKLKPRLGLCMAFVMSFVISLIPLILKTMSGGEVQQRFNTISIASADFLKTLGKTNSWGDLWGIFVSNYELHLTPEFLLYKGDPSFVHSTRHFGILSPLDVAAVVVAVVFLCLLGIRFKQWQNPLKAEGWFLVFLIINVLIGIIPSAITNSEIPNSLRIAGSWPFMCLFTAFFMFQLQKQLWPLALVAVMGGMIFFNSFLQVYFGSYQNESKGMFCFWTKDQADAAKTEEDWFKFGIMYKDQDYHFRYYLMQYRADTCSSTRTKWFKQREFLQALNLHR